jgi:hypothetical protein
MTIVPIDDINQAVYDETVQTNNVSLGQEEGILLVDEPDASTTYVGWAPAGTATSAASWKVVKIAVAGTVTSKKWADGNKRYDNVWDDRATLTYS